MEYGLGVDLGTTHTAAAINVRGDVEAVRLGGHRPEIPTLVFLRADDEVLVGDAAQRRGETEPTRLAREFKRRLGDPVPVLLGGTPMSAHALTARVLRHVTDAVSRTHGGPPARIVLTHPANWGPYKRELLMQAAQLADLGQVTLRTEPEAAAVRFATTERVAPGETIAVYDLGGGTFDAAVLRKTADGFEVLGEPQGVEQLGGIDFDEAILEYVRETISASLGELDLADPAVTEALARLRRECVEAKESLSFDTEAEIAVALPRLHTRVRLGRAEFEAMIRPALADTVAALRRALRSAAVDAEELRCIVLAGGSARIPLVASLVSAEFGRPVAVDEEPELGIALGAARLSGPAAAPQARATAEAGSTRPVPASVGSGQARFASIAPSRPAPTGQGDQPATGRGVPVLPRSPVSGSAPVGVVGGASAGVRAFQTAAVGTGAAGSGSGAQPVRLVPGASEGTPQRTGRAWLRAYRWPAVGVFVAVLLTVTAVTAATAWPRDDDDSSTTGGGPSPTAVVTEAALLWRTPTGVAATEPPAVSADRVFVSGQDGTMRAFRRTDGGLDWELAVGPGLRASTDVAGGVVYAVTEQGAVVAVDAALGTRLWRRNTGNPIGARPAVGGERVYAGGGDGVLYAYEPAGGHRRWRTWTDDEIRTPPTVTGEIAVVAAGRRLYGVDENGAQLWKPVVGRAAGGPSASGDAACLPVDDGTVRCVRMSDGTVLPRIKPTGTALSAVVVGEGTVFATAADGTVAAWATATGELRWRHATAGGAPEAGFPVARAGEIDVAYPDGLLVGLDAGTGAENWRYRADDAFSAAPSGDEAGLYAVGDSGTLFALRPPGSTTLAPEPSVASASPSPSRTPEPTAPTRTRRPARTTPPTRTSSSWSPPSSSPTPTSSSSGAPESGAPDREPAAPTRSSAADAQVDASTPAGG